MDETHQQDGRKQVLEVFLQITRRELDLIVIHPESQGV